MILRKMLAFIVTVSKMKREKQIKKKMLKVFLKSHIKISQTRKPCPMAWDLPKTKTQKM